MVGVLAVLALFGVPAARTICAIVCAPASAAAQSVTAEASHHAGSPAAHHHAAMPLHDQRDDAERGETHLSTGRCDTHDMPEGALQATLTTGRSAIDKASVVLTPVFGPESFSLTPVAHATSDDSPPRGVSRTSIPLVLRI
jgi:hypothetical protein